MNLFLVATIIISSILLVIMFRFYRALTRRVEGHYFDSNGVKIHYTDEGKGIPVILLHGFAVNADLNWRSRGIVKILSSQYRVICLDMRGHGLSGKPHSESAYGVNLAEDVPCLMDHLGIQQAHLVGYSLGGFVSLYLAANHPQRFFSASILGAGWESPENQTFSLAISQLADALEAGKGIKPLATYLGEDRSPGVMQTLWVKLMTAYFNDKHALIGVIRGLSDIGLNKNQIKEISIPLCNIIGDQDSLIVSAKALQSLVPDIYAVVIEGANHMQATGRPELISGLKYFLASQDAAKQT